MGASILGAAGLPELVAHDDAQFVDIACRLAGDLDALSDLRGGLRERMRVSALCDTEAHARRFEAAIEQAFAKVVARGR
jgi:predicted O-linked N-acetylglucosamine transferase (SPINDLY family)